MTWQSPQKVRNSMAYAVMSRKFLRYENELSVERMEICVDAASDLPTVNSITGCKIGRASCRERV